VEFGVLGEVLTVAAILSVVRAVAAPYDDWIKKKWLLMGALIGVLAAGVSSVATKMGLFSFETLVAGFLLREASVLLLNLVRSNYSEDRKSRPLPPLPPRQHPS
jgi:cell division protein FtsX